MNVKQLILGQPLGSIAMTTRSIMERVNVVLFKPESAGMVSNDHLAEVLVVQLSKPNTVFIDVGAHIGSVMAAVQSHDSSVDIVAVEAIPKKVKALRHKFPHCEIYCCAAGASEGNVSFFVLHQETGYSSLTKPSQAPQNFTEITVPMRTIDSLIPLDRSVDVVKIDVEGAELGVLKGASTIIEHSRPTILFESGPDSSSLEEAKAAIWNYLKQLDYGIYLPNRVAHNGPGLEQQGFIESHWYPRRTTNYFAIANERRDEIRTRAREILNTPVSG